MAFIGYPGRIEADTCIGVRFRRKLHATFAYDVTNFTIFADGSRRRQLGRNSIKSTSDKESEWGGISGSPCFVVRENFSIGLAGFTTSVGMSNLRFTLANCLNPDGTIIRISHKI